VTNLLELQEIAEKFSFIKNFYFNEDMDALIQQQQSQSLTDSQQPARRPLTTTLAPSAARTTKVLPTDMMSLLFPLKLKFTVMLPKIFDQLCTFIGIFLSSLSLSTFSESLPYLHKVIDAKPASSFIYLFIE
jgi:hypothetical protein